MNIDELKKLYFEISNKDEIFQKQFEEALETIKETADLAHENAYNWDEAIEEYYGDVNWGTPEYMSLKDELKKYNLDKDPAEPYHWLPSDYACQ